MIVNVAGCGLILVLCIWLLCETKLAKHYLRPDSTSVWTYAAKHIHVAAAASAVPGRSGNSAKLAAYGGASVVFKWTISGRQFRIWIVDRWTGEGEAVPAK